ncbi:glutaredoxin domain-containing protein [Leucobacter sp. NPDC015123]|uniref:glutaredoxin domain-containing protein n=1 Tax=Leucobacter sp. NPDC015123 TaxID=3364129 RepID=UPI0036F49B75
MTTVRVYSKPNCVQCTMTKTLLDALEVPYVLEDITEPGNLAAVKELGFLAAPVVTVGDSADDMWSGFQPDRIKETAARFEKENA